MKQLITLLLLVLSTISGFSQTGGLIKTIPPVLINAGDDYATLVKKYRSGGYRWYYYISSAQANLKWPPRRLPQYGLDSVYAVNDLPGIAGWSLYDYCIFQDGDVLAYWNVSGLSYPLVVRHFGEQIVLTQKVQDSPDAFVLRGKNLIYYTDVTLATSIDTTCYNNIDLGETDIGGLAIPSGFITPDGYELITSSDGTPVYIIEGGTLDESGSTPTDPANEVYVFTPQKDVTYDSQGNIAGVKADWSIVESGGKKYLRDANWSTGFDTGTRRVYFGAETNTLAGGRDLTNYDITPLEGMDIAPLILYDGKKYTQSIIHVKANPTKSRRVLELADKTYYWMPPEYEFTGGLLPNYYNSFPDFTPPSGKIVTHLMRYEDDYPTYKSNNKGLSHSPTKAFASSHVYDYDQWAKNLGFPEAYTASGDQLNAIIAGIDPNAFRQSFVNNVISPNGGRGIVTLNFEVFKSNGGSGTFNLDHPTMYTALNAWTEENANALLAFWAGGQGGVLVNRILFESQSTTSGMTPDLLYSGDYSDWLTNRAPSSIMGGSWGIYRSIPDIFYINDGYQTKPDNIGWLHHAITMTYMNRKFFPDKKLIFQDNHKLEYQLTGPVDRVEVKNPNNGEIYKIRAKPIVSPGQMFTRAAFATAYADGIELWESPQTKMDDPFYYGNQYDDVLDINNNPLPTRVASLPDGNSGKYVDDARPMTGVDWSVAGVWAVSQNKDIVEAATSWSFNEFSVDGGSTWVTGNATLPTETYVARHPLSIFKKNVAGTEGLLVFMNPFQDATKEVAYKVRIDGNVYDIFQVGDYASVVRINLTTGGSGTPTPGDDTGEPVADNFVANETLAAVGYIYGSNDIDYPGYKVYRAQSSTGVAKFNFYGNPSPNNNYPPLQDSRNTGGNVLGVYGDYSLVDFPSHSVNYASNGKVGKVHMKLYDSDDNLVWELYDTRGGSQTGIRPNNHPDNCARWVHSGTYRLWVKNISTDGSEIRFNWGTTLNNYSIFDRTLLPGETWSTNITFGQAESNPNHRYKGNCNTGY